jgi:hypothetical protein
VSVAVNRDIVDAMSDLLEIQKQLQQALTESTKLEAEFQAALAKITPLRDAVTAKQAEVNSLIGSFQKATGADVPARGRRGGAKKTYNTTPQSKVDAVYKRTLTRLTNQGVAEKEATKQAKATSEALAKKLGIK